MASVVLSCVYPENFGVFSPPTLLLLQIPLKPPIEHYLDYCDELAVWGSHFLGTDVVQVEDRALWVFYQDAYGQDKTRKAADYQKAFESDSWVRQRHALNTLKPYFRGLEALAQAQFLIGIDNNLAATIAGCEFEARIKEAIHQDSGIRDKEIRKFRQSLPLKPNGHEWGHLESMIEYVVKHSFRTCGSYSSQFQHVRELRNVAIHDQRLLDNDEVELMIEMAAKLPGRRSLR